MFFAERKNRRSPKEPGTPAFHLRTGRIRNRKKGAEKVEMKNMPAKSPCFGCQKRVLNCHSVCKDYLQFQEARKQDVYKRQNYDRMEMLK